MQIAHYRPGSVCWFELATTDFNHARSFYQELFGWTIDPGATESGGSFSMLKIDDVDVGAMYQIPDDEGSEESSSQWIAYVAVDDIDTAVEHVVAKGGRVALGPRQVATAGKMAMLRDPEGAVISLWEAHDHPGSGLAGVPGTLAWSELAARDPEKAIAFYSTILGWEVEPDETGRNSYTSFLVDGEVAAGMIRMTEEWGDLSSHWMCYFRVESCKTSAKQVEESGGIVHVPPTHIPARGIFSVVTDPTGAVFSLLEPRR